MPDRAVTDRDAPASPSATPHVSGEFVPVAMALALGDPGAITPRGDNYEERLIDWQRRAVVIHLGMVRETRTRWVWPEIPDGWRLCDNGTFTVDGRFWRTATNAPRSKAPFDHESKFVYAERFEDERWVTPWVALSGSSMDAEARP